MEKLLELRRVSLHTICHLIFILYILFSSLYINCLFQLHKFCTIVWQSVTINGTKNCGGYNVTHYRIMFWWKINSVLYIYIYIYIYVKYNLLYTTQLKKEIQKKQESESVGLIGKSYNNQYLLPPQAFKIIHFIYWAASHQVCQFTSANTKINVFFNTYKE